MHDLWSIPKPNPDAPLSRLQALASDRSARIIMRSWRDHLNKQSSLAKLPLFRRREKIWRRATLAVFKRIGLDDTDAYEVAEIFWKAWHERRLHWL